MNLPLVTIVTPSYNQGRFIRVAIESVLSQDYPHIEYIIMDGGSTDETAAVVRDYASRLAWISEKDRGQSDAINKGFRMAKGEIVSWLNSDDLILPGAVGHAVRAFECDPRVGAVYGEGYQVDEGGKIKCRFPATEAFNLWKLVYLSDYILQQTSYFRKSVFEEIGYLNESLHWGMDWDIFIRIGKRRPLGYIPEYMGCIREHEDAKTFCGGAKRFKELAALMRFHTGRRYPPGYVTYGLDTYEKIWLGWVDRCTPGGMGGLAAHLKRWISLVCRAWIDRTTREAQGWYSDGWATTSVEYMLPPGEGELQIEGVLPELSPALRRQKLRVEANGVVVIEHAVPFGPFRFTVGLAEGFRDSPLHLRLRASRCVVPAREGLGADRRRLAYTLKGIYWSQ